MLLLLHAARSHIGMLWHTVQSQVKVNFARKEALMLPNQVSQLQAGWAVMSIAIKAASLDIYLKVTQA